jgi:hypothetical protein
MTTFIKHYLIALDDQKLKTEFSSQRDGSTTSTISSNTASSSFECVTNTDTTYKSFTAIRDEK